MKKLYHIKTTIHNVVLADSGDLAKKTAQMAVGYSEGWGTFHDSDFEITEIKTLNDIPFGWDSTYPLVDTLGNFADKPVCTILQEQLGTDSNDDLNIITLNGKKYKRIE